MKKWNAVSVALLLTLSISMGARAQQDPGPRPGPAAAGGPYPTLNANEQAFFSQVFLRFQEVDSVSGTIEQGKGLGPTFNGNSCAMCHAQPFFGGTSPGLTSPQNPIANPQVALATLDGATNTVPSFITTNGPVREARFIRNANGSPDGGVHGLYTIAGRSDAPGCTLGQPDFAHELGVNNVIFRIPTPVFGLGLVENTPDATLQANLAATKSARSKLGIGGSFNTSGNDGTITRFGWKAQNKSLLVFAGEAYNVEQGATTELFPNKRSGVSGCVFNGLPEDASNMLNSNPQSPNYNTPIGTVSEMSSDVVNFAVFMRLSAPPTPAPPTPSTANGSNLFNSIGCALCHSPSLTAGASPYTGMGGVTYQPYSDFALHHMGSGLADGISQGAAGPDQFRTAPLWGVGQRLFFLHDGRTSDLLQAIKDHSASGNCRDHRNCDSEADAVIRNFKGLSSTQVQDLLNFLRSL
ncbi:MAG: thiol oxidoreductase [Acidobacteriia bacterium]|nr:thiol oxidoreductase [Terriglobia bacterium]